MMRHEASGASSSSGSDGVPAIFLSHSGVQKPFVETLFRALQRANHTAFFDQHSLLKGSRFPPLIKTAARGCELGVVVLSEDFLTSKWPMIELEILVLQRPGAEPKVLPLFYKLRPDDLKSPENLSRWRKAWKEKAGAAPDVVVKWGEALRALRAFNGEIYTQGTSEALYIDRVVHNVCKQLPSPLPEDLSPIKGLDRLAKEVAGQFDQAHNSRQCEEACLMIGLHGLGGLGKTTMCQIMVNFYSVEYPGRCHHLEFPTDDTDKPQIVQGCKKALKGLTNLSDEVLNKADKFDQVIQLMKKHLSQLDVFLAVDNVWESSSESAERILEVGFSANSKILLMSRSEQLLKDLLGALNNTCVRPLPALEHHEAFQIFEHALGKGNIKSLESCRVQVDRIMERFLFAGNYHALALKALGGHVRKGCTPGDSKKNEDFLSRLLQQIKNEDLGKLENVIRLSYDNLPEVKQHMFLDIAVLMPLCDNYGRVTDAEAHQWLSVLYKDQFRETKILTLIYELARDGLLQLVQQHGESIDLYWDQEWPARGNERIVSVHDLYSDLAEREAEVRSRFFISGRLNKPVEEFDREKVERVILRQGTLQGVNAARLIEKLQQQGGCRKLQVLYAAGVDFLTSGIDMRCMPFLCVLSLKDVTLRRIKKWSAAARLEIVFLSNIRAAGTPYDRIPGVRHLQKSAMRVLNLNALIQLRVVHLERCYDLERIQGLDSLKNLQRLTIEYCTRLEDLDLSLELGCLEELVLIGNRGMEGVGGFSPRALKMIRIKGCGALKSTPDLSGSTRLEALELRDNGSMEEVQGVLSSTLEDLVIVQCCALKNIVCVTSDLGRLTRLDRLHLDRVVMVEELGGLSSTIRIMRLLDCGALKRVPDISGLTRLVSLHLRHVSRMEEVAGCLSPTLEFLRVASCGALRKLPDLSGLTRLNNLHLNTNDLLEEVGCLSSTLKVLEVYTCKSLKKLPDVSGLTCLETLSLDGNSAMEEVGGQYVSSTLDNLTLVRCERMQSFPSLKDCCNLKEVTATPDHIVALLASSRPPNLHRLRVWRLTCEWLSRISEQWEGLTMLKELTVSMSDVVIIDFGCLSGLKNLQSLTLYGFDNLEEIASTGQLQGLERLILYRCGSLRKLDGFRDIQAGGFKDITLKRCPSREDIHWSMV